MQKMNELTALKDQLESSVTTLRRLREGANDGENPEEVLQRLGALRSKLLQSRSQLDSFDEDAGNARAAQYLMRDGQGEQRGEVGESNFDGIQDVGADNDVEDDGDDDDDDGEFDYDFGQATM